MRENSKTPLTRNRIMRVFDIIQSQVRSTSYNLICVRHNKIMGAFDIIQSQVFSTS